MSRLLHESNRHWTRNLVPGEKVYGERLRRFQGKEFREWSARRSKIAAYMEKGGRFELKGTERVLYLGAASGTTVSHLSDLLPEGLIYAVELSARPFRDLLRLAALRPNIIPILGDAHDVERYGIWIDRPVDVVVQDIAQRDQVDIFRRNVERFLAPKRPGLLAVKSRSINVAADPRRVYQSVRDQLKKARLEVRHEATLEPFETDHAMFWTERG